MKKRIGQVFALALTVSLLVSLALPVSAVDSDYSGAVTGWWDKILYQWTKNNAPYWWGDAVQSVSGFASKEVCGSSSDAVHHASSVSDSEMVKGPDGSFAYATCTYCHERFKVYASDLQQSYEAQVEELPASSYNSDGSLLVYGVLDECVYEDSSYYDHFLLTEDVNGQSFNYGRISFDANTHVLSVKVISGHNGFLFLSLKVISSFEAPYDGYYTRISSPGVVGKLIDSDGTETSISINYGSSSPLYYEAGATTVTNVFSRYDRSVYRFSLVVQYCPVIYKFTPAPSVDINFNTTYNINSRPTSITGNYGIIGDNGQIIKVEGNTIVNETNNTIYNPATGETHTLSDWSYNYSDRSYTVTTESGDTVTIIYGDENVTIKEGDITYNIYYLVDGSGSEGPGPDVPPACNHQWTETSATPATCAVPGSRTLTCPLCNETKTETIPAPGHKWVIRQTINTEYDEEGNKTQDGYTIYSCSVCGEQYKDMEGTGPPGPSDGGDIDGSGLIEFLDALIKSLSKNLHGAVELILSFFQEVPTMFGGFLAFLAAMFPFLPPEIMTLLTFGIAAVVFIGIIKAIRR